MHPHPERARRRAAIASALLLPLVLAACTPTPPPPSPTPWPAGANEASGYPPPASAGDDGAPADATRAVAHAAADDVPGDAGRADELLFPVLLQARPSASSTSPTSPPAAGASPVAGGSDGNQAQATGSNGGPPCAGILQRDGARLVLDGQGVTLFGVNATFLMDKEVAEDQIEPLLATLGANDVNTVRVWFFSDEDPDRFARLLDSGARHGIRFIVTLADNVFKGRDWFGTKEDEKRYRPHLKRTVERFKDRPEILMWELINEPNCGERHDDECLDTIKSWLRSRAAEVKAIDACHLVTTGLIGAGNYDNDRAMYRRVHREPVIDVVSAHRRSSDDTDNERETAEELDKPILYGEVYDEGYDDGCNPLSDDALPRRAERIADDVRDALGHGVAGYLLWDYAPGRLTRTNGKTKDYCNKFGFQPNDPLWAALRADPALPPPVPWRPTVAP